jgi:tight adherence protein B
MTMAVTAALLAAAVLAAPTPPRRRLVVAERPRRGRRVAGAFVIAVGFAVLAVAILVSLAAATAACVALVIVVGRRGRSARERRRRHEGDCLGAALEVLVGELRVGAHPVQAFEVAARESGGTVGEALRAVASRARLGADVTVGLRALADDSAVPMYWERMAVCWQLAADHGLAMSVLMRAAHRDIVDRQRFADRVEAGSAGARATAVILAGLPALGVLLGQLIGAHPLGFLLAPGPGGWLLVAGVVLIGLGVVWADAIIDRAAR